MRTVSSDEGHLVFEFIANSARDIADLRHSHMEAIEYLVLLLDRLRLNPTDNQYLITRK